MGKWLLILLTIFTSGQLIAESQKSLRYKISYPGWEEKHEIAYRDFIHLIGIAGKSRICTTTDECLRNPIANPLYYKKNPDNLKYIFADCADLPFVLRAYFSWMEELPFSYPIEMMELESFKIDLKDIRYSKFGNVITHKQYLKDGDDINNVFENIKDLVSTASYRTDASKYDSGNLFRDTYPVAIDRKSIVAGTIVYDPDGHVAIVYY